MKSLTVAVMLVALAGCGGPEAGAPAGAKAQTMVDASNASVKHTASTTTKCVLNSSFLVTVDDQFGTPYPRQVTLTTDDGLSGTGYDEGTVQSFRDDPVTASIDGLTFKLFAVSQSYFYGQPPQASTFTIVGTIDPSTGDVAGLPEDYSETWIPDRSGTLQWSATGVATCTATECPAAPAIANSYLRAHGIDPNGPRGRMILSAVTAAMGPGTSFEGLRPCDPGYAVAVEQFVRGLLLRRPDRRSVLRRFE